MHALGRRELAHVLQVLVEQAVDFGAGEVVDSDVHGNQPSSMSYKQYLHRLLLWHGEGLGLYLNMAQISAPLRSAVRVLPFDAFQTVPRLLKLATKEKCDCRISCEMLLIFRCEAPGPVLEQWFQ